MIKKPYDTPNPPSTRLLAIEIECYFRRMREFEVKKGRSDDMYVCRAEITMRTDLYKQTTTRQYERITDVPHSEKIALISLFNSLSGHGWKRKFGWIGQTKTSTKPLIKVFEAEVPFYDGITVTDGTVVGIDLCNNSCEGNIPEDICNLENLVTLKLNMNNISGSLPRHFYKLEKVDFLNLSSNQLTGCIQNDFFPSLQMLQTCDLSCNSLSGEIPNYFENSFRLLELNLSGNSFTGEIPSSLSTCVNLKVLKLYENQLHGSIPGWFRSLNKLVEVNLSNNK
jgi:Leucine-rich repeat (LRR) protein